MFGQVLERRAWATKADAAARGALVLATIERLLVGYARETSLRPTAIEILAATLAVDRA